jgi:DtxR family Mn-dependent transcriptional regulator
MVPLSILKEGQAGKVMRVNDFDNTFLQYISKIGIKLNNNITVKDVLDFDGSMLVLVEKKEINISNKIAANIFVEEK